MRSRGTVLSLLSAVVVVAGLVGVGYDMSRVPGDPATKTSAVEAPLPDQGPLTRLAPVPAGSKVIFYGDSYTYGQNASSRDKAYAPDTARWFHWNGVFVSQKGTGLGYRGEDDSGTFADRFSRQLQPALPGTKLLIIQGGQNDSQPENVLIDGSTLMLDLASAAPSIQVVIMGPVPFTGTPSATQIAVDRAMRQLAAGQAAYVSPVAERWFTPQNVSRYYLPGANHPTDTGYAYIASRLVQDLQRLGVGQAAA